MQPNQPSVPNGQSPYDFLYHNGQPTKKSWLPRGASLKQRLLIAGAALVILIIIVSVGFSLLLGGGSQTKPLVGLAQNQNELIRVASLGVDKAISQDARGLAATTNLSLTSAQQETLNLLKQRGRKVSAKELAATKDGSVDQTLSKAELNNRFDETFTSTLRAKLTAYQAAIRQAFNASTDDTEKQLLNRLFNQTVILLGQKPAGG